MGEEVVALRFDASSEIGLGHLHRAMSLSSRLQSLGKRHILVAPHESLEVAMSHGVPSELLHGFDQGYGESLWAQELKSITHVVADFCHHRRPFAGKSVQEIIQTRSIRVMVLDSMPPTHFVTCSYGVPDFICTPYLNAEEFIDKPNCRQWLVGAKFAPLAPPYLAMRGLVELNRFKPGNFILVCCGGSDPSCLSALIASKLIEIELFDMQIFIVVGSNFSENLISQLESIANQNPSNVKLLRDQRCLATLISDCAFLIGRAGLIRYEAACLGKTAILVQDSTIYEPYLRQFETCGFGYIFLLDQLYDQHRFDSMLRSLKNKHRLKELSQFNQQAFNCVDAHGIDRLLNALLDEQQP